MRAWHGLSATERASVNAGGMSLFFGVIVAFFSGKLMLVPGIYLLGSLVFFNECLKRETADAARHERLFSSMPGPEKETWLTVVVGLHTLIVGLAALAIVVWIAKALFSH
jgi:hypothetical protein